ncbi:unnamed protein product, partial [Rotaria magnacalcarata]
MELNNNIHNTTITGVFGDDFKLGLVKICLFSTFFVLGLIGNSLVLIGIGLNKGMQTSTNLLIFNLAAADVLFIIFCIIMCIPIGSLFTVVEFASPAAMYCLLRYLQPDASNFSNTMITSNTTEVEILPIEASIYWLGFVIFLYALPLTVIVILYGLMLKFLRGARGQSVGKSKRRATRMILAVILTYALCWFFMQLLFISNVILSRNTGHHFARHIDILTMFANIFAYLNSCTNPILYGFMSKNFRSSFIDLLCCHYPKQNIFCINESLRNRRMTENNYSNANNLTSMYCKSDYLVRASVVSHFSQLTPMITANSGRTSSSLSPATNEIITD